MWGKRRRRKALKKLRRLLTRMYTEGEREAFIIGVAMRGLKKIVNYRPEKKGEDVWKCLAKTIKDGHYDCEDFGVGIYQLLILAGFDKRRFAFNLGKTINTNEWHQVLSVTPAVDAVLEGGKTMYVDNRLSMPLILTPLLPSNVTVIKHDKVYVSGGKYSTPKKNFEKWTLLAAQWSDDERVMYG